jgi:NADPH:quinone reductase-like Zn-dependent oxidoreductase
MKAIRFHEYGTADVLRLDDVSAPQPGPGQVLVRIRAASVNAMEHKLITGALKAFVPIELPFIPGGDFAGVVETVAEDVTAYAPRDEVYGCSGFGGSYAEFVAVPATSVARKPKSLSFVEAASVPVAGLTAWQALFDQGHLQGGQTVLIQGAAGGVGSMAVQLAHVKGATVFATASASNKEYLESLGADTVIDYRTTRFEDVARDVDLVFDMVGGETQQRSFAVLKPGGRIVSIVGQPSAEEAARHSVQAVALYMQPSAEELDTLSALLDSGTIKATVTGTFPLSDAARAVQQSASGHTRGKIVLEVG